MTTTLSRTVAAVAAMILTTSLVAVAAGDDAQPAETPSAAPATAEPTATPGEGNTVADPAADLAADLGAEIRGTSIISGPDLIAQLDPNDPRQAQDIADIEALLDATGASLDQLTMLNGVASDGRTFVGAIRVEGADQEVVKSAFVESALNDLGAPRETEVQIDGRSVTRLIDDAAAAPPLFLYAAPNVVWLISGTEEAARIVIETLP